MLENSRQYTTFIFCGFFRNRLTFVCAEDIVLTDRLRTAGSAGKVRSMMKTRKPYDKCIFHVDIDSEKGDKIRIRFPVRAARKILKASGKLPLPQDALQEIDLKELMEAVAACLDEEVAGDFVTVETAGGTHVRVYVDEQ